MKLLQLSLVGFLFTAFTMVANAQIVMNGGGGMGQTGQASIEATAYVMQNLTVSGLNNLEFGDVTAGMQDDVSATQNNEPGESAGKFKVEGTQNADVQLTVIFPAILDLAGGGDSMPLGNTEIAWNNSDNRSAATFFNNNPEVVNLGGFGTTYVWVGGSVQPNNTQAAGNYSGTITLEAEYN